MGDVGEVGEVGDLGGMCICGFVGGYVGNCSSKYTTHESRVEENQEKGSREEIRFR